MGTTVGIGVAVEREGNDVGSGVGPQPATDRTSNKIRQKAKGKRSTILAKVGQQLSGQRIVLFGPPFRSYLSHSIALWGYCQKERDWI
jgi:hypothetical protein